MRWAARVAAPEEALRVDAAGLPGEAPAVRKGSGRVAASEEWAAPVCLARAAAAELESTQAGSPEARAVQGLLEVALLAARPEVQRRDPRAAGESGLSAQAPPETARQALRARAPQQGRAAPRLQRPFPARDAILRPAAAHASRPEPLLPALRGLGVAAPQNRNPIACGRDRRCLRRWNSSAFSSP